MIAYLMAAGNGMRLRPMTNDFQKSMLPVGGRPMLEWWIEAAVSSECFDQIFVNVHHMADQVKNWVAEYSAKKGTRLIHIIDESDKLLGTAGTIYKHGNRREDFMIAYTDTFSEDIFHSIPRMADEWSRVSNTMKAGLVAFTPPGDQSTGNMTINKNGVVTSFKEKGKDLGFAWSGMMFCRKSVYTDIFEVDKDIAKDVLPRLIGKMMILQHVRAYDIGRGVEHYEQFRDGFKKPNLR